jgi:hypothetical protein
MKRLEDFTEAVNSRVIRSQKELKFKRRKRTENVACRFIFYDADSLDLLEDRLF